VTGQAAVAGARPSRPAAPLLELQALRTEFRTGRGVVRAVDGVDLTAARGETIGIVGESGSGKSVLVRSIMGLYSQNAVATVSGTAIFDGKNIAELSKPDRRRLWGTEIAMIFQDPTTSLNPVKTIGAHLAQPLRLHLGMTRAAARERAVDLLDQVGISDARRRLKQYPHELSGGMRQRVCIALALTCDPKLLIADEPTTALDVTVQRQILDLLDGLAVEKGMTTLLITHDLGVVAKRADRIMVMYAGRIVESREARALFRSPRHPYTKALMSSIPRLSEPAHTRLAAIGGRPPDLASRPAGCSFAPRCACAQDDCRKNDPALRRIDDPAGDCLVACHHPVGPAETG
jgi:peptide/nickel transport system ATP-binding protein